MSIGSLAGGGAERQFAALADALIDEGVQVALVTLWPGGSNWEWLAQRKPDSVVSLYPSQAANVAVRARMVAGAPRRLYRILHRLQPDVVYSALTISDAIAWIATRRSRSRLVWGWRSSRIESPEERVASSFCRRVSRTVPMAIANSEAASSFHHAAGFRPRAVAVIPNGIDTQTFRFSSKARASLRGDWGLSETDKVVGSVGRLRPVKDHESLLLAAARLARLEPSIRVVVVGDGPTERKRALRELAEQLRISDRILWLGHRTDVSRIYSAFDVFCLSSRSESSPNVLGEAMACGVRCVTTDVGDARRIVGEHGIVVPTESAISLSDGLAEALAETDPGFARRARAHIEADFSLSRMVAETRSILERVREDPPS